MIRSSWYRAISATCALASVATVFWPLWPLSIELPDSNRMYIQPAVSDLGTLEAGSLRNLRFSVSNPTTETRVVIGSKSGCTCLGLRPMPLTVPPKGTAEVTAAIEAPRGAPAPTDFELRLTLLDSTEGWLKPVRILFSVPADVADDSKELEPIPLEMPPSDDK